MSGNNNNNCTNTLRILYWNANSLSEKVFELYEYMQTNQMDIACLSETFLKPIQNIHRHPHYVIYRLDRDEAIRGGGVAIIIKKTLKHELIRSLNMSILECIGITVQINEQSSVKIYSIYLPGSTK